jgi:hypothetical protein
VYVHGIKRAGHSQFTVAISALSNPQVHELLSFILHKQLMVQILNHYFFHNKCQNST